MKSTPLLCLVLLTSTLSSAQTRALVHPQKAGKLGHVRYTLANNSLHEKIPNSEIFRLSETSVEFIAPVQSMKDIERLSVLSHEATNLCGSIDYYPPGYTLATTVTHYPPHFSPEAQFAELTPIIDQADLAKMNQTITALTATPTRYHRHATGQNAGATVSDLWKNELSPGETKRFTVELKTHPATVTPQKSVVAKLVGDSPETVILGAHLDSINSSDGPEGISPGADDDASGVAILTEILRIIESQKMTFHRTIELHAYAAEEAGLLGSRDLAAQYKKDSRAVAGMMQFDMAYYSQASDFGRIYFLENYTSLDLLRNNIRHLKHYVGSVYDRGALPSGTASDHRAWWEQGYPTLFPFENPKAYNTSIHSASDDMNRFDDGLRMTRFVQLGLLFLSYHAGLKSLDGTAVTEQTRIKETIVPKDLFLRLEGSGGTYNLKASTPKTIQYLEYCTTKSADDFRCSGQRFKLDVSGEAGNRKLFSGTGAFKAGEIYRVEAFDAKDDLLARRHIKLAAR